MSWLDKIEQLDHQILLFINSCNHPFMDDLMWLVSMKLFGVPFYLFFILLIFWTFEDKKAIWWTLTIMAIVGIGDFIAHNFVKDVVQRYRPSHHQVLAQQLHYVHNYKGGQFGFVSNHATNMSALATMVFLVTKHRYPKLIFLLIPFVLIICYSRMYLGVHYLTDIMGGVLLGMFLALMGFVFGEKIIK